MKRTKLESVLMNNYVKPDVNALLTQSRKYITNGNNNEYFYLLEKSYIGSPTNQAIIDSYVSYILGAGLKDVSENPIDIEEILSDDDLRAIITDFKIHGSAPMQVVYQMGKDKKVSKVYYVPTKSVAIDKGDSIIDEPQGYWYSFDWQLNTKFKPVPYPAFGYGENKESEIAVIKRPSPQPLFPLPDYQSGLQYCHLEEELSNFYINHITNNFSVGKIINVNQGLSEDTDEAQEEAERAILSKVSGSGNAGKIIVSFNDNKDNATTVENIEITDAYQQFEWLSKEATTKIMLSHKVTSPSLFGLPNNLGFSSGADEMSEALKTLYRSQINPMRKTIISTLTKILKINKPNIKLEFVEFDELDTKTNE